MKTKFTKIAIAKKDSFMECGGEQWITKGKRYPLSIGYYITDDKGGLHGLGSEKGALDYVELEEIDEGDRLHACVKEIEDTDDALVWVNKIPVRVENGELIWSVEFVHYDRFEEYKTSELHEWYSA